MSAVFLRARANLRAGWRGWVFLALIVGLLGGVVTGIVAGARRTETAYPRFLTAMRSPDFGLVTASSEEGFATYTPAQIARLPDVADVGRATQFNVARPAVVGLVAPEDDRVGHSIIRKKILAGRDADPRRADEATISFVLADALKLHVGDDLRLAVAAKDGRTSVPIVLHVVGIDAAPLEFPPQVGTGVGTAWTTRAFARAHHDLNTIGFVMVRLRDRSKSLPAFQAALRRESHGAPTHSFVVANSDANTERSINLQATALWILAGLLGLAALLVLVQLLSRQSALESGEFPVLRGLGMTRGQLWLVGMLRAVAIGAVGAVLAAGVAVALSPLMPIGLARDAEPHPGVSIDLVALLAGTAATFLVVLLAMAWPAARDARDPRRRTRRHARRRLGAPAASPPVALGVRFATDTTGEAVSVPLRTTVACSAVGVVALVAAFAFSASLQHLLATPRLYGVTWDAEVTSTAFGTLTPVRDAVESTPGVEAVAEGYVGFPMQSGHTEFDGMAMRVDKGSALTPTPLHGRLPTGKGEIMLGVSTASTLRAHVGSTIPIRFVNGSPVPVHVVGIGAFPTLSDSLGLGQGGVTTISTLASTLPPRVKPPPADTMLVRFGPSVDKKQATADLARRVGAKGNYAVLAAEKPVDLVNFGRVQNLPILLAGLLAAFAALTLVHLLVTSIRRRRREFAMLRALGFTARQLSVTVAALATTLIALALVVGVPLGLVLGRLLWRAFAHNLGILYRPVTPVLGIVLLVPAALLVANLVALASSRRLRRVEPATVLHTE